MTIRYQCPECDSVLKIKDELAGTDGKCPKCKSKFVVPEPTAEADQPPVKEKTKADKPKASKGAAKSPSKTNPSSKSEHQAKSKTAPAAKKSDDDDFDPADFLMEDGPGPKASAGLTTPTEEKPKGPPVDSQGRRLYTGGGSSKARAASMSPAAAAAAAAADGQNTSSANARDLLSKSADESRVKASAMPVREKQPIFDFAGAGKELARYAPHAIGAVLGIVFLYWGMNKMLGESIELPELGPVSGTVTVNGEPLPGVTVNFSPLDDIRKDGAEGPDRVRTSSGVTDENGYYTLYYLGDTKGAAVGKGRLWLEIRSAADLKKVPPEWSSPGPNIREVKATGNNSDGEFNITIKKSAEAPK